MASWSRLFPGRPEQVAQARLFTRSVLAGRPEAATAELVVSELATNAVLHSASGGAGGSFVVSVLARPDGVLVGVDDLGSATEPAARAADGPGAAGVGDGPGPGGGAGQGVGLGADGGRVAGVGGAGGRRHRGCGVMTGPPMPRRRRRITAVSAITGDLVSPVLSRVLDSRLATEGTAMPGEYERIARITDPYELLRAATGRLGEAQQEVTELARLRRRVIQDLHAQGMSYAQIAEAAGLSRGRIHQIRHTGPAPEGAFLGTGAVTIVTPLRRDTATSRQLVALDDVTAGKRIEDLARAFGLAVGRRARVRGRGHRPEPGRPDRDLRPPHVGGDGPRI